MTYASLALLFVGVAMVTALAAALHRRLTRQWWWTTLVVAVLLVVLTAAFDSAMIASDLFRYGDTSLLGPRVLLVPIEDFAWPVAAAVALPALWELLAPRRTPSAPSPDHDLEGASSGER
jgi:lycopene cyclase domain-containing protein